MKNELHYGVGGEEVQYWDEDESLILTVRRDMTRDTSDFHIGIRHPYGEVYFSMPLADALPFFATAFTLLKAIQEQSPEQAADWHLPFSQDEFTTIRDALLAKSLRD